MQPPKQNSNEPEKPHSIRDSHLHEFVHKKHLRYYAVAIVAIILLCLFLIGLFPRLAIWREIQAIAEEENISQVTVLEAEPEDKVIDLVLPSTTNAIRFTPIWARVDGYIDNFLVDIGDHVKEGDLLAVIDTPETDKQLAQARADLLNNMAQYEIAKISADRWEGLYKRNPKAIPKQEVDERNATLQSSIATVKAGQANVERLEKIENFKNIYAPFSGIITERNIEVGSLITAGSAGSNPQQLFMLDKIDVIRVFVNVPQFYYRKVTNNMEANITIQEFPGRVFKGYVTRTAASLDPVARTMLTEVHIDNRDETLTTGLYANVTFSFVPPANYFIVPTNSVIIIDNLPTIAILDENNKIKIVPVTLGRDFGKTIEITSGLKMNDKIILNPDDRTREGAQVKVRKVLHSLN